MFAVSPISGTFGAEITGIDLGGVLDQRVVAKLKQAFLEYKVLVFHDQASLTPARHVDLGRQFGDLQIHPFHPQHNDHPEIIVLTSDASGGARENWHSDESFREVPPLGSILRAVDVPAFGRDTAFADMEVVHEGLSSTLQRLLGELTAVHDWRSTFGSGYRAAGGSEDATEELDPAEHPVVRTHPETGRRSIYVNPVFTSHIVGMKPAESRAVLCLLYDQTHLPEYQLRCRWGPHTVAMWDNRSVQHALVFDRAYARVMHRVTIAGTRPR